jgi:hypothetical protein
VRVSFDSPDEGSQPQRIEAINGDTLDMQVELPRNRSFHTLNIVVDGATSPLARTGTRTRYYDSCGRPQARLLTGADHCIAEAKPTAK